MRKEKIRKKSKRWQIFENNCHEYLINNYGDYNVDFNKIGDSNSNCSDIEVIKNLKNVFNIEVKMKKSQCGQFALRIEDDKFIYSQLNKSESDTFSKKIIDFLNLNYNDYKNVKQSTLKIDLPQDIFEEWIMNHYSKLNSKFIITGDKKNKIIVPIKNIKNYFKITCCLRRKKSGSRDIPKSDYRIVKEYLENNIDNFVEIFNVDDSFFIKFDTEIKKNIKFDIENNSYKIILCEDSKFGQIKKLGKTNNPTVIFSLDLYNGKQLEADLDMFLNDLKKDDN